MYGRDLDLLNVGLGADEVEVVEFHESCCCWWKQHDGQTPAGLEVDLVTPAVAVLEETAGIVLVVGEDLDLLNDLVVVEIVVVVVVVALELVVIVVIVGNIGCNHWNRMVSQIPRDVGRSPFCVLFSLAFSLLDRVCK